MATVKKNNRVLTVAETAIESYLKEGYDQIDEKGKIIKKATGGRAVPLVEHNKALDRVEELEALQAESELKIESVLTAHKETVEENEKLKAEVEKLKKEAKK